MHEFVTLRFGNNIEKQPYDTVGVFLKRIARMRRSRDCREAIRTAFVAGTSRRIYIDRAHSPLKGRDYSSLFPSWVVFGRVLQLPTSIEANRWLPLISGFTTCHKKLNKLIFIFSLSVNDSFVVGLTVSLFASSPLL